MAAHTNDAPVARHTCGGVDVGWDKQRCTGSSGHRRSSRWSCAAALVPPLLLSLSCTELDDDVGIDGLAAATSPLTVDAEPTAAGGGVLLDSTNASVDVDVPYIYRDSDGMHYVAGAFRWHNNEWRNDFGGTASGTASVGGLDGLGVRFSQDIVNNGGGMTYAPSGFVGTGPFPSVSHFSPTTTTAFWDNSAEGASFQIQDKVWGTNCGGADFPTCMQYNADYGSIDFKFKRLSAGCLQVFTGLAHTWNTTNITGFTVGLDGFGLSWANSGSGWLRTSAAAHVGCGDDRQFIVGTNLVSKYRELAGPLGVLGKPNADMAATSCTDKQSSGGQFNQFDNGSIHWSPHTGAHATTGSIRSKWASMGWECSVLGFPTSDDAAASCRGARFTFFEGGAIHWSPQTGAHATVGPIRDKWASTGWECGPLGLPTSDDAATSCRGARFNFFENGAIHWSPQTGAHVTLGPIRDKWGSLSWECGPLGLPTTDDAPASCRGARYAFFQGGAIHWSSATGAHVTAGAIRDKWASLGWECSFLGLPTSDDAPTSCRGARFNFFQGGAIHWSPTTGAHVTTAAIRDKWASLSWECGFLGLPVTDEASTTCSDSHGNLGRFNNFQGGAIYSSTSTGAYVVRAGFQTQWNALGRECSQLGFPLSDEFATSTGSEQRFAGGNMFWDRVTGAITVVYRCDGTCKPGCPC
jgi:uncharacterized protein with LGFP repeats